VVREALTQEMLGGLEPRDAAALFVARRAEGLSPSEQQLLADWLARDEAHRRLFDSADRAWRSFDDPDADEVLEAMRAHALGQRQGGLRRWAPAAAAAIAASIALVVMLNPWSSLGPAVQYASARGEVQELQLPDGSTMTLDADSEAIGRFGRDARDVDLRRGRAFFAVATDQSRSFVVTAADTRVVALGTRFDVNLTPEGMTVTLLEGRVQISSDELDIGPAILEPGQQYVERQGEVTIRTIGAASENAVAWRSGLINFDDQPLADAAAVMNRYSDDQIVIRDPTVASLRVSGQFRAGETQRFADTLAEMHNLRAVRRTTQIELTRPE
jgi:transmembrane sensor